MGFFNKIFNINLYHCDIKTGNLSAISGINNKMIDSKTEPCTINPQDNYDYNNYMALMGGQTTEQKKIDFK